VESRLKGYKYFEIERDLILCPLSGDARIQGKEEMVTDIDSLQKNNFDIDCLYHREGNEQTSFMFKSVNISILQCALSEPISSSRKTRKLTVCRFI
jgi:hypothetical protein